MLRGHTDESSAVSPCRPRRFSEVSAFAVRLSRAGWLFLAALGACSGDDSSDAAADGAADALPQVRTEFRVVTWNVRNFFDSADDPERMDERRSASEVGAKIGELANVLNQIDADFVALQEVETEPILERLAQASGYAAWGLEDGFDGRGLDVAFMSKVEPSRVVSHLGEAFGEEPNRFFFTRDALEVFVEPGGFEVGIMILHLRSMLNDGDQRRLAEAAQARNLVERRLAIGPQRLLVVGDFNDFPGSDTLNALLDGPTLRDLTREVPLNERYSYIFDGMRQQLDYQLGTAAADDARVNAAFIRNDASNMASDHDPVVVDFVFEP